MYLISKKKKELEQLEEDLIRKEDEIQLKKITFNKERNQFHVDSENYYRMKLEIAKYKRRMNGYTFNLIFIIKSTEI